MKSAMSSGRKNKVLNMGEKIRLIQGYEEGLSVRQLQEQFQCGKTQIYETLKRRHDIRREYGDAFHERSRRGGKFRDPLGDVVDGVVWAWFADARVRNMTVSGSMLRDKAKSAALKLDFPGFEADADWLTSFLKRHNVPGTELVAERALVRPVDLILPTRSPSVEGADRSEENSVEPVCQDLAEPILVQEDGPTYLEPLQGPEDSRLPSPLPDHNHYPLRSLDDDAHDHFIRFVDSTLRSITPDYRKDLAKLEIQQVLIKYKHSVDVPLGQPSFTTLPSSTTPETT